MVNKVKNDYDQWVIAVGAPARKPQSRKKTLRETLLSNQQAMNIWSKMRGIETPKEMIIDIKPKRVAIKNSDPSELEASVINEVSSLLAHHPRVLFAVRQNSGAAYLTGRGGKDVPVWFYRVIASTAKMRISDFWGILCDGRLFGFECKRRSWTKPVDQREFEQLQFLMMIQESGGIGRFVTCAEDVIESMKD